jgi:L-lactate dehydrogenase complex protein LldG
MSSSRDKIMTALKSVVLEKQPLPEVTGDWIRYDDPWANFSTVLTAVGGTCVFCEDQQDFLAKLNANPLFTTSNKTVSLVAGVPSRNCQIEQVTDPHELEGVEFSVVPGEFAIAENAAVWVVGSKLVHRSLPFLTQHKAIVVSRSDILHNMHEAYSRAEMKNERFGVFISGPSKTADIEQSLVIGAHGARSLTVYVLS